MKMRASHRIAYILLSLLMLFSVVTFPRPCHAWGAVTNTSLVTAVFSFFMNQSITAAGTGADVNTHVRLMKAAHEFLAEDMAVKESSRPFPDIESVMDWDRVYVYSVPSAMFHGGEWRWPWKDKGGPDATGATKDSFHYYNPVTEQGGAPDAVSEYYASLVEEIDKPQDTKRDTKKDADPDNMLSKAAAWSAHFLADMHVPYHVVGVPAVPWYKLSEAQAGPGYLCDPETLKLDNDRKVIESTIVQPADAWGQDGDFSGATSYFKTSVHSKDTLKHDWFDPWYNNGPGVGLSPNAKVAVSSHARWETEANRQLVDRAALARPLAYDVGPMGWENAVPQFGLPQQNMENHAAKARAYTVAAAKETRGKTAQYLKYPAEAANKAIERIATLWRSAFTALRPEISVTPSAGDPKVLRVTATVKSVEPRDPAVKVRAKLNVEGGKARGDEVHSADAPGKQPAGKPVFYSMPKPVEVLPGSPWVTEWEVDTDNPDSCQFSLEVIGEYRKTPDLQYAECKYARPLSVTLTPSQVEPKGKEVTLTVRVDPPQETDLEIKIKPPQKSEIDLKDWGSPKGAWGKLSTGKNGEFKANFSVKEGTASGSYQVIARAPKLKQQGSASLSVGRLDLSWVRKFRFILETGSNKDKYSENNLALKVDQTYEGGFNGNTFTGKLQPKDGYSGTGDVTITVMPTGIPTYYRVTQFNLNVDVEKTVKTAQSTSTSTVKCTLEGDAPAGSLEVPIGDKVPIDAYGAWMKHAFQGEEVCKYIKAVSIVQKTQYSTQTKVDGPYRHICNTYASIRMGFAKE